MLFAAKLLSSFLQCSGSKGVYDLIVMLIWYIYIYIISCVNLYTLDRI